MKELLVFLTENAVVAIDLAALIVILIGTAEAFVKGLVAVLSSPTGHQRRDVWLRFGRWLVAGLTFQLAADIIETSITADWRALGRIAAVAVIRTFLNYFLERDMEDLRRRQREGEDLKGAKA